MSYNYIIFLLNTFRISSFLFVIFVLCFQFYMFCWLPNRQSGAVGQSQSGESGERRNRAQSGAVGQTAVGQSGIKPSRANRAVVAIGQIGQFRQSGNRANRAIGQLDKQSLPTDGPSNHSFCQIAHLAGRPVA